MARFDVYRYAGAVPLVVDVQADILSDLQTRTVIPLLPRAKVEKVEFDRLMPVIPCQGKKHVLMTAGVTTVLFSKLGEKVGNFEPYRHEIVDALDFLMQGF